MHLKEQHKCQIDCTNHDQVINNLQIKSKDLYYFWRNYQWLYNKYYSQSKAEESHVVSTQQFEEEIQRLSAENKRLRMDNESLRKQLQGMNQGTSSKIQHEYQRQIDRLNAKCRDYEGIREKLSDEISNLKNKIRTIQDDARDNEDKYKRQIKRQQSIIVELEKNIDELRQKLMKGNPDSSSHLYEKHRRQMHKVKVMMNSLQQQSDVIIEEEFQHMRRAMLEEFPRMFERLTTEDLSNFLIEEIERSEHYQ